MNSKFKKWMALATTTQQERLAKLAKSSRRQLYNLSTGNRHPSAAKAGLIADASEKIEGMPALLRGDLCEACAQCPHFKACKG